MPEPLRVLSVDDDLLVLTQISGMLEALGHRVREASSGRDALAIEAREPGLDLAIAARSAG